MPYSDTSLRPWIAAGLAPLGIGTVVDVGAGSGTAPGYYRGHGIGTHWTGIEIWEPYLERFSLPGKYDEVILGDARALDLPPADLYLFGDVLEHMPAADAVALWGRARKVSRWLAAGLPVLLYEQGAEFGNPHEEHVAQWDTPGVLAEFEGIWAHCAPPGSMVGAFLARGLADA